MHRVYICVATVIIYLSVIYLYVTFSAATQPFLNVSLHLTIENAEARILTNDIDVWSRTKRYESVRRSCVSYKGKWQPQKKATHRQLPKNVRIRRSTETSTVVKKKLKKRAKLVRESRYEVAGLTGIFRPNDDT